LEQGRRFGKNSTKPTTSASADARLGDVSATDCLQEDAKQTPKNVKNIATSVDRTR